MRKPTDAVEIRAIIGLLLTAGHLKQQFVNVNVLWNEIYESPIFRATMSKNRFKFLLKFIRFVDKSTRTVRREKDKFAQFRDV